MTAFRFTNREGVARYGRYRISPAAGIEHLDAAATKNKDANYLFDELTQRIVGGPIQFDIQVQITDEGDIVDDATVHWPLDRRLVQFGSIVLSARADDEDQQQKRIIFDPIPRVDGIEPSDDPLLELRAAIYLLSGRRRRQASESQAQASKVV